MSDTKHAFVVDEIVKESETKPESKVKKGDKSILERVRKQKRQLKEDAFYAEHPAIALLQKQVEQAKRVKPPRTQTEKIKEDEKKLVEQVRESKPEPIPAPEKPDPKPEPPKKVETPFEDDKGKVIVTEVPAQPEKLIPYKAALDGKWF